MSSDSNGGGFSFTYAEDMDRANIKHKILVVGESGVGKTHALSLCDKMFLVPTEANGVDTAYRANPKIAMPNFQELDDDGKVVGVRHYATSMDEVRMCLKAAVDGSLVEAGFTRFGIDGLTECQRLMKDEIVTVYEHDDEGNVTSVYTKEMSIADWGLLTEKMRRLLRFLRDLPMDVLATALQQVNTDEKTKVRYVQPSFQGQKLPGEVVQYFNAACHISKTEKVEKKGSTTLIRTAMFEGPSRFLIKPCGELTGRVAPDAAMWMRVLKDEQKTPDGPIQQKMAKSPTAPKEEATKKEKDGKEKKKGARLGGGKKKKGDDAAAK